MAYPIEQQRRLKFLSYPLRANTLHGGRSLANGRSGLQDVRGAGRVSRSRWDGFRVYHFWERCAESWGAFTCSSQPIICGT